MEENGEDSHAMQTEENMEELNESHAAGEDAELEDMQKNGKGSSKKRGRKKAPSAVQATPTPKKPERKEPVTPASDRPARERKSIDRFADTVEKEKEKPKEFKIEQGAGTCLKDIPNVVFKLSKRKTSDEPVQLLHKLLFNKRGKPHQVKSNILQFSGCIWGPNEEREKAKVKEKLEKCVKDTLCQVSDLLDINISRTTRKEDVVLRVLEFLDCPHKTTEKLIQEEEQRLREKKRKKTPSKGKRKKSTGQTPRKRQKHEANEDLEQGVDEDDENEGVQEEPEEEPEEVPVKKKKSIKIKEPSRDAKSSSAKKQGKKSVKKASESEDAKEDPDEPAEEPEEPEEVPEEPKRKRSKNKKYEDDVVPKSPKKGVQKADAASKSPKKGVQKSVKKKSVYEPGDEDLDDDIKDVKSKPLSKVSKKPLPKETQALVVSPSKEKKKAGTSSTKAASKKNKEEQEDDVPQKVPKKARGASNSDTKEEAKSSLIPPDEDLRAAICELLRDADFSTVTFTDVVKQLGAKFDVDLSQNKAHVKNLIQEEISKIVDEDDGEGDNEDEEAGIHTPEKKEKELIAE